MGAATGTLQLLPEERRAVGSAIVRAVRLEAAAHKGQLVIDEPTFRKLPDDLKPLYGDEELIRGKRSEQFRGRRCTFVEAPDATIVATKGGAADPTVSTDHVVLLDTLSKLTKMQKSSFEVRIELCGADGSEPVRRDIELVPRQLNVDARLGEKIIFQVTASEDCYIYVIDIGTTGRTTILFPNRFSASNRLRARWPLILPTSNDPYEFVLSGVSGREVVQVVALDCPVERLLTDSLPSSFEPVELPRICRDITIISQAEATGRVRLAWSQLAFDIKSQL
jgi:hypothetical protein